MLVFLLINICETFGRKEIAVSGGKKYREMEFQQEMQVHHSAERNGVIYI